MKSVTTCRHWGKFYFSLAFGTVFFLFLAAAFLLIVWQDKSPHLFGTILMLSLSFFALYVAIYGVIRYYKNAPVIYLDKDIIKFNDRVYYWSDIEKIELKGQRPFKYLINHPMESVLLKFNDTRTELIFDEMYSNTWEAKLFIDQIILQKKAHVQDNVSIVTSNKVFEDFQYFKGNSVFSFRGILLWGGVLLILGFSIYLAQLTAVLVISSFLCLGWFFFHSARMDYFGVSENYFQIKNHNLLWRNKTYVLNDISEIVFEANPKMPNSLRVIAKNYKYKLYKAGTLNDQNWKDLRKALKAKGISVINHGVI